MANHTYQRRDGSTRAKRKEQPPDRILHYDPRSLHRTETPVVQMGVVCTRCFKVVSPDEIVRNSAGDLVCQSEEECWEQQRRNLRGGW
jgi:hypothetical protein